MQRSGRVLPMQRLGVLLVPLGLTGLGIADASGWAAGAALVVAGLGMGLQLPSTLITVQQSVGRGDIGTVTAFTAFFRQLGGAIGIAVLSSVLLYGLHGSTQPDAVFRHVMWLGAAIAVASLALVARLPDLRLGPGQHA
jgi:hypothetical protein